VFVALLACLLNVSGLELMQHKDLDLNQELRDAGLASLVSGGVGGIPAYHAVSLTSIAQQSAVGARAVGFAAAVVPLAVVAFGAWGSVRRTEAMSTGHRANDRYFGRWPTVSRSSGSAGSCSSEPREGSSTG